MATQDAENREIRERLAGISDPVALLAGLFTASPVAFQIYSADGHCLLVNQAFRDFFQSEPPPEYNVLHDEIAAATGVLALVHRAFAGETVTTPPMWYDPRELTQVQVTEGRRVAIVGSFFPVRDAEGRISHVAIVFKDVTPEMHARELAEAGRRRAEAAERRSGLLSRISALLSAPLDEASQPRDLAGLLVPEFADLCSVFLIDEAGVLQRVAEAGASPELEAVLRRMRALPLPGSLTDALRGALGAAEVQRFPDYAERVLARIDGADAEYVELIRELGPRDSMLVPLRARGRVIGLITLGMLHRSGRRFEVDDESLAREIGERAGLGIDNARLFAEATAERAALRISEERRRLAVEAAGTGTWDYDMLRDALTWDARCRELFGISPEARVDYSRFLATIHTEDRGRVDAAIRAVDGPGDIDLEYRVVAGEVERWIRTKGQAFFTADGRPSRLLGTAQDISDRKRSECELRVARQRAEEANAAKDEFLAMLGHELRNPLSPILTALQLMRMRNSELVARERAVIERQVHHMVRLVDDLLDVSRITRRKVTLKRAPIELAEVIDKALEIVGPLLEQRTHQLTLVVPSTGLRVEGDEHRLTQVIANLLTNAARYTEPGGKITITGAAVEEQVQLSIRDNGAGIDAELLPRIFDLFVQGRRSIDRADGGLGLGLTIVRSLVELHGGTVSARSDGPGRGSEFIVRLPIVTAAARVAEAPTTAPARAGSCRVLIVDDNRDAADLLSEVLEDAGHTTRVAYDGPGALRLAPEFRPQLALLDIGLPVMDGFELARRLRELPGLETMALVALTGYGQPADRERSRVAGFDMHLTKPVEVPELEAVVAGFASGSLPRR